MKIEIIKFNIHFNASSFCSSKNLWKAFYDCSGPKSLWTRSLKNPILKILVSYKEKTNSFFHFSIFIFSFLTIIQRKHLKSFTYSHSSQFSLKPLLNYEIRMLILFDYRDVFKSLSQNESKYCLFHDSKIKKMTKWKDSFYQLSLHFASDIKFYDFFKILQSIQHSIDNKSLNITLFISREEFFDKARSIPLVWKKNQFFEKSKFKNKNYKENFSVFLFPFFTF